MNAVEDSYPPQPTAAEVCVAVKRFERELPPEDRVQWTASFWNAPPEARLIEGFLICWSYAERPPIRFVGLAPNGEAQFQRLAADLGELLKFRGQAGLA